MPPGPAEPLTIPVVLPVRFAGGGLSMQTTTARLGAQALFVRSMVPPKEGATVGLALGLPGSPVPLELAGIVSGRGEGGFWVTLSPVAEAPRARLEAFLRSRGAPPAPVTPAGPRAASQPGPQAASQTGAEPAGNRRAFSRVPERLQVGWASPRDFLVAYAENISRGGIFVVTPNPPALDESVELYLELPDGEGPVRTQAIVVQRILPEESARTGHPVGAGLQFVGAKDDFRQRLDRCLDHLIANAPG